MELKCYGTDRQEHMLGTTDTVKHMSDSAAPSAPAPNTAIFYAE